MAGSGTAHLRDDQDLLLRVENLVVEFPAAGGRTVKAVSGISFDIKRGETLGLVGESGCGKSTTGRAIIQLPPPTGGSVKLNGVELTALQGETLRRRRTDIQMIFQDPISSLNPRRQVGHVVAEPLDVWGSDGAAGSEEEDDNRRRRLVLMALAALGIATSAFLIAFQWWLVFAPIALLAATLWVTAPNMARHERGVPGWFVDNVLGVLAFIGAFGIGYLVFVIMRVTAPISFLVALVVLIAAWFVMRRQNQQDESTRAKVDTVLEAVGIDPAVARDKRPHEFSGGQCQRISIARSLVLDPSLLICDEPVSALDVSVQAQILNLLDDLKHEYDLTLVFIAHDLAVVKNISDRVAVMYLGKMCEIAPSDELYGNPAHPYTALLIGSVPEPDPDALLDLEIVEEGDLPSPINPPSGCRFRTRCPRADDRCAAEEPTMAEIAADHYVACHHPLIEPRAVEVSLANE